MPTRKTTAIRTRKTTRGRKLNPRQKREVKSLISRRIETKHVTLGSVNNSITNSSTFFNLSNITQGTGGSNHIGDDLTIKKIMIKFNMIVGDSYNNIRLILFRWLPDANAEAPATGQILDTALLSAGWEYLAPYNRPTRKKYHIIMDKTYTLVNNYSFNSSGTVQSTIASYLETTKTTKWFKFFGKKLGAGKVEDTNAGIGFGNIYLLAVSDSTILPNPKLAFSGIVTYTDA